MPEMKKYLKTNSWQSGKENGRLSVTCRYSRGVRILSPAPLALLKVQGSDHSVCWNVDGLPKKNAGWVTWIQ